MAYAREIQVPEPTIDQDTLLARAERGRTDGDWNAAILIYIELLHRRLRTAGTSTSKELTPGDLVLIDRTADLAVPFGYFGAAADLLSAYVELCEDAGNRLAADFAKLKCVELSRSQGDLFGASERLAKLKSRIGDLEDVDFTPTGLLCWEESLRYQPGCDLRSKHPFQTGPGSSSLV